MGTWDSLHREHFEIYTRVNILEKALIDLLEKHTAEHSEKALSLQKDFLEAFEHGISMHFAVEEEALFPALRETGRASEVLVQELLAQHRSIMEKYSRVAQTALTDEQKKEILLQLVQELSKHHSKEEQSVPTLVKRLNIEQLVKIDRTAKSLGYTV